VSRGADLEVTGRPRLEGKRAVISGAARGIGRSIAEAFVREGAEVIAVDIAPAADAAAPPLRRLDVTSEEDWRALADELAAAPPDVVVNNAGGLLDASVLHEHSTESWRRTLELNLTSVFFSMRSFIPQMVERGRGSIINVGSISGVRGQADAPAYQAAKAGVAILTRNAAVTYARFGVRVNTLTPSVVATEAVAAEPSGRTATFLARVPLGRPGRPDEVASAAVFLASDESSYMTGADLAVDGGFLA
jgi:NAD(P)-dependent dehydrogenase (short-subunit alcohol dehydrogenase family)